MPIVRPLLLLLVGCAIFAATPGRASAYLTAVSVTTEDPSSIAGYSLNEGKAGPVQLSSIEFPSGATDTRLIGLSFRPQSEDLYALGSGGTLYVLQGPPYKAVQVDPTPGVNPLQGASSFGVGFNPVKDAIAVVDDAGHDLLLSPFNGSQLNSDGPLAYASGTLYFGTTPVPVAAAFADPVPSAQTTTMYVIDSATDSLAIQGPAESAEAGAGGVLRTVGKLELDVTPVGGFGFPPGGVGGGGFALLNPASGGPARLCRIALHDVYAYGLKGSLAEKAGRATCDHDRSLGGAGELEGLAVVPPSTVEFSFPHFTQTEGSSGAKIEIERSGGLARAATVSYGALPGLSDKGFTNVSGSVTFEPGQTRQAFAIPVRDDRVFQRDREVVLQLSASGPDTVLPKPEAAGVTIVDDELNPKLAPKFRRPKTSLGRVLREGRLVVHYSCRAVCSGYVKLVLDGNWISTYAPGRRAGSRALVFQLNAKALRAIREHVRHGAVRLGIESEISTDTFVVEKTLNFRLRR